MNQKCSLLVLAWFALPLFLLGQPTIVCPPNLTVQCANLVPPANTATVTASSPQCDNVFSVSFGGDVTSGQTCPNRFTIVRTYIATDCIGTATCSQRITVRDTIPPTLVCQPAPPTVSCASQVPPPSPADYLPVVDNCGTTLTPTVLSQTNLNQTCANRFLLFRVYIATDLCGNVSTCARSITVNDQTPPTITCPQNVTVSCNSQVPAPSAADATASDNCGTVTVTFNLGVITQQTCLNRSVIVRTYTATDACQNSAACSQFITVFDATPPTITCPANQTVSCTSQVPACSPGNVNPTDNCGGTLTTTCTDIPPTGQTCANRYTFLRVYSTVDACGNSAACTQIITVNDQTPPTITCPANQTVACANQVPAPNSPAPTASDNCGGTVTTSLFSDIISNQTCANRFTETRIYRATDVCGNTAQCTQTITVNDQTPSPITCPANQTFSCANQVPTPSVGAATVGADNCGGAVVTTIGQVISNQTCANRFIATRTFIATDVCGNSASCSQTITVNDQTPPALTAPPPNVTAECSAVPVRAAISATDNCDGARPVSFSESIVYGICQFNYTLTRVWTATDVCGNAATVSHTVQVQDTQAPTFTGLPANIPAAQCVAPDAPLVTVQDNCSQAVGLIFHERTTQLAGACDFDYRVWRTWDAVDDCGNAAQAVRWVDVVDTEPPVLLNIPSDMTIDCWCSNDPGVQATDNCDLDCLKLDTWVDELASGNGKTIVICRWTAEDKCQNKAVAIRRTTVLDTKPPVFDHTPPNLTLLPGTAVPPPDKLFAEDVCGFDEITITFKEEQIGGKTIRTWTACDPADNCTTVKQTIEFGIIKPVFTALPSAPKTVPCTDYPLNMSAGATAIDPKTGQPVPVKLSENTVPGDCAGEFTVVCTWTATDAAGNSTTQTGSYTVLACPPPALCPQQSASSGPAYIRRVQLADLDQWSNASRYSDFSGKTAHLLKGAAYALRVRPAFVSSKTLQFVFVKIDWNHDGAFDGPGETAQFGPTLFTISQSFQVPMFALSGLTRMRVLITAEGSAGDCATLPNGEVEDYTLLVKGLACPNLPCTMQVANGLPGAEFIQNVLLANIQNPSGAGAYSDFTAQQIQLERGKTYPFHLLAAQTDGYTGQRNWTVLADWNRDGDFQDAGETPIYKWTNGPTLLTNLTVPATALPGATVLRIKLARAPLADPCAAQLAGEVEDYGIYLEPAAADSASKGLPLAPVPVPFLVAQRDDEPLGGSLTNVQLMPNPTDGQTLLRFVVDDEQPLELGVFDASGRQVLRSEIRATAGENDFYFDTGNWATGLYRVSLAGRDWARDLMLVVGD